MGLGTGLMKSLMFVFNGIVWVLGLVLFVVGIVVLVEGENWNEIIDGKTVPVSVLLIIVGLVIAIVGFLGCFGALKQNSGMLLVYAIVLGVVILVQLVAGILAFIYSDEAKSLASESLIEYVEEYDGDTNKNSVEIMNLIMEEFDCCGVNNATDFLTLTNSSIWNQNNVPDSCCKVMQSECGWVYSTDDDNIWHEGCLTKFTGILDNVQYSAIAVLVAVLVQVILIVISCQLRKDAEGLIA